jgi:hypothetical protein
MILKVQYRGEPDRDKALKALAHQVCNHFSPNRRLEIRPAEWNNDKRGFEPGLTCISVSPFDRQPDMRVLGIIQTIDPVIFMIGDREEEVVAVDVT